MNPDISSLPLRDIHLPDAVSWWPLAPGWWLVIALLLLTVVGVVLWRYMKQQSRLRREALEALNQIIADYDKDNNAQRLINQLSILLRRLSVSAYPAYQSAGLTGKAWLGFLDNVQAEKRKASGESFCTAYGALLITMPYKLSAQINREDIKLLIKLCQQWIKALPACRKIGSTPDFSSLEGKAC